MRFGYEYELTTGSIGISLFSASDQEAAQNYVNEVRKSPGYVRVFNLQELPTVCTIGDFKRLFPGKERTSK